MNRDTRYPVITAFLLLRPQYDPTSRAGSDVAKSLLRVAKAEGFRNRRGAVVSSLKSRRQRLHHCSRGREVVLQRVHTVESALRAVEIGDGLGQPAPDRYC